MADKSFDAWIDELREDVIQDEFGYEPGEFTVYPDAWRALFIEGLTTRQACQRALDAFSAERDRRDCEQKDNYERIRAEDAAAIARRHSP